MFRDFSESAKQKLLGYVAEVTETSTWGKIGDAIGDMGLHVQHWLGWMNVSRYVNDLDKYHKKVIDKNNTTKKQIEEIFAKVEAVDGRYEKGLNGEVTTANKVVQLIRHLAETIDPNGGNLDMGKMASVLRSDVEAIQDSKAINQTIIDDEMLGTNPEGASTSVDPVNLSTGNFIYEHEDLRIEGEIPLSFHRFYNSKDARMTSLGRGFRHNYEITLKETEEKTEITLADGQHMYFEKNTEAGYISVNAIACSLEKDEKEYRYSLEDGRCFRFDLMGKIQRMEDSNNRGISFLYSDKHQLIKAINDNGDFFEYTYSAEGLLKEVTDQTGRKVLISYENNYISSVSMPENVMLCYEYAANGKIVEVINSQKVVSVQNEYDNKFRVIKQKFPDGAEMSFEYDDEQNLVIQTERNGSRTVFIHDDKYRNTEIRYSDGSKEKFVYNERSQCVSKTNRNGSVTRMAYDHRGNLTQIIDSGRRKANMTYDSHNRLLALRINGKIRIKNSYDHKGNLICSENALGNRNEICYDAFGRKIQEIINKKETSNYTYDEKGNVATITGAFGKQASYVYDDLNRVIVSSDANGNEERYSYDSCNRIVEIMNAEGNRRRYTYNTNGKPIKVVDYDGFEVHMVYDTSGRLAGETDKEGNQTTYTYDKMWNVASVTEANDGHTQYKYDFNNRMNKIVLSQGGEIEFSYDFAGNRTEMKDPEGNITKYEYNSENMPVKVTEANGAVTRYEYDLDGNLIHIYDALDNVISITYDEMGNKTSYTDENGYTTKIEYLSDGKVKRMIHPNGGMTVYEYDEMGRLHSYKEPDGMGEEYTYDANGNLLSKKNPAGEKISYEYDCMNRVVKTVNPMGGERSYTYDAVGNITSVRDENDRITFYEYSPNGNLIKVTSADQTETLYEYDVVGNVKNILRKGEKSVQETEFEWDLSGNVKKIKNPLGDVEEYIYNKCGLLIKKIDQEGYETSYHYDSVGKIDKISYADNREARFSYNLLKQLEVIHDWSGITNIKVDKKGMPLSITDPHGDTVQYEWGSMGEKRKIIYPDGEQASYEYNAANQLIKMCSGDEATEYRYDKMGRFISRRMPNGLKTEYSYNNLGRISRITNQLKDELLEYYEYQYDPAGNKIKSIKMRKNVPEDSGVYKYQYDSQNRLTLVTKDEADQRRYQYDAYGNRVLKKDFTREIITKYVYNLNNQLISEQNGTLTNQFEYDRRGNIKKVLQDDRIVKEYIFDSANRMSQLREIAENDELRKVTFFYNALGNRIGSRSVRKEDTNDVWYTLDLTRKCHNVLGKTEDKRKKQIYFYDGKVMGATSENGMSYYLSDDHGSPTTYVGNNGIKHYRYDEFGNPSDNDFSEQPFGYTGYLYDEQCGLYYAQARMYNPELGRFNSEDKVRGFISQPVTLNRYSYCCNKPEDFEDDDGEWLTIAIGAAVGGLVSAGISVTTQVMDGVKSGKSIGDSFKDVNYAEVGIEAVKGAAKGAIAGTGIGLVATAASGAAIDMAGDVAKQTIVEGKNIKDVDKSRVVETGIFSFAFSLTVGQISKKVSGAITKKLGVGTKIADVQSRENAKNVVRDQLAKASAKSRINKLTGRLAEKTSEFWKTSGKYTLNKVVVGLYSIVEGEVYKRKLKKWVTGKMDEYYHCELAV